MSNHKSSAAGPSPTGLGTDPASAVLRSNCLWRMHCKGPVDANYYFRIVRGCRRSFGTPELLG